MEGWRVSLHPLPAHQSENKKCAHTRLENLVWAIVIERVTEQCLLSACAMNLIRLVKAANAVFIHCLGAIFQGLFRLGYLSTAPFHATLARHLEELPC